MVPVWTALPFLFVLLAIALLPIMFHKLWDSNRNKAIVMAVISAPVLVWLLTNNAPALSHSLAEYASFICLLGSLFVISGGIALTGDLRATPVVNTAFLAVGAVLANIIGTTGASMILIRPFLRTNSERKHVRHLPVLFIFIVSNCGGLLTPLGDPPLFLGYLRGVPFAWTFTLLPEWCVMVGALSAIAYVWDRYSYKRESRAAIALDESQIKPLRLEGWINFPYLGGVICAVFLHSPWREIVMIMMALLSVVAGPKTARRHNRFTWHPIVEVAIIFAGIFVTMVPALILLKQHAPQFGLTSPAHFFWATGLLSSALDNAPTYLTFLSVAQGLGLSPDIVGVPVGLLKAISVGAVFMGANTYIGNGPNFMVKAIADHAGFHTPSFFGYVGYTLLILFPLYCLIHAIFF